MRLLVAVVLSTVRELLVRFGEEPRRYKDASVHNEFICKLSDEKSDARLFYLV